MPSISVSFDINHTAPSSLVRIDIKKVPKVGRPSFEGKCEELSVEKTRDSKIELYEIKTMND